MTGGIRKLWLLVSPPVFLDLGEIPDTLLCCCCCYAVKNTIIHRGASKHIAYEQGVPCQASQQLSKKTENTTTLSHSSLHTCDGFYVGNAQSAILKMKIISHLFTTLSTKKHAHSYMYRDTPVFSNLAVPVVLVHI